MAIADKFVTVAKLAFLLGKSERWVQDQFKKGNVVKGVKSYEKLYGYRQSPYMIVLDKKYFKNIGVDIL